MIVLVAWSGGVDSTHAIFDRLRKGDIVTAINVRMRKNPLRMGAEIDAMTFLSDEFRSMFRNQWRGCEYVEVDRRKHVHGADVITTAFEAGVYTQELWYQHGLKVDEFVQGICKEEAEEIQADTPNRKQHIINAFKAGAFPLEPAGYVTPPIHHKRELIEDMGDLAKLTWSCRNPHPHEDGWLHCGFCPQCKVLGIEKGKIWRT